MEQAGYVSIAMFIVGVIFWSGWLARSVADHERRLQVLETLSVSIHAALREIRGAVVREVD